MRKILLSLIFFSISGLYAQDACETDYQTKKPIDCECYTPHYYDLQDDYGFFFDVEFLYWYARETNLSYALQMVGVKSPEQGGGLTLPTYALPSKYKDLDADWDPGFRVGLGWNTDYDGWDVNLKWTYYHNKTSNSSSVTPPEDSIFIQNPGETMLINPWVDQAVFNGASFSFANNYFQRISATWRLNYNLIDLELGRKFWLSKRFALRSFAGLRGAWTKTIFKTASSLKTASFSILSNYSILAKDRFTNKLWGVGFLGGIQPTWHFCPNFILFGNLEAALIWGNFRSKKHMNYLDSAEINDTQVNLINIKHNAFRDYYKMQAIIDLAIGLRWEENWQNDRYKTTLDLGWEHHIWLNHGSYTKNSGIGAVAEQRPERSFDFFTKTYFDNITDLVLGGLVARFQFDF